MVTSIWDDIKREFSSGNMVTRLIIINLAVFVLVNLVKLGFAIAYPGVDHVANGFQDFLHLFCMSTDMWHNITHPWVIFTSMFLHEGFGHILWNMLFLYWFGRIVGGFIGDHHILPIYILSGLAGGVAYYLSIKYLYGVENSFALGASGAINGIILASAIISPNYVMRLLFIGDVKLKWIVAVLIFMDMMSIANMQNTGGHIAHLGGAAFGWFYIFQLRSGGTDLSKPVNNIFNVFKTFFENIFSIFTGKKNKLRVEYKNPQKASTTKPRRKASMMSRSRKGNAASDSEGLSHQEKLDAILDKIKKSGYESLTAEEKDFLYNASKQ